MFEPEDWVWHDRYGRGQVAAAQGPMTYVLWDDMSKNEVIEDIAPPTEEDENGKTRVVGPSPLDGHYIYLDEDDIRLAHEIQQKKTPAPKESGEQPFMPGSFHPGWFKVNKVTQSFAFRWDEEKQAFKPKAIKGQCQLNLTSADRSASKVSGFPTKTQMFYVPGRYATNTLSKIMEEGF